MTLFCIDPRRITEFHFGGPYFGAFDVVSEQHIKCQKNGDVFDYHELRGAWMESQNLAPISTKIVKVVPE